MKRLFWTVDYYGWLWKKNNPKPKDLAEAWGKGLATEVSIHIPGRRDLRI